MHGAPRRKGWYFGINLIMLIIPNLHLNRLSDTFYGFSYYGNIPFIVAIATATVPPTQYSNYSTFAISSVRKRSIGSKFGRYMHIYTANMKY